MRIAFSNLHKDTSGLFLQRAVPAKQTKRIIISHSVDAFGFQLFECLIKLKPRDITLPFLLLFYELLFLKKAMFSLSKNEFLTGKKYCDLL